MDPSSVLGRCADGTPRESLMETELRESRKKEGDAINEVICRQRTVEPFKEGAISDFQWQAKSLLIEITEGKRVRFPEERNPLRNHWCSSACLRAAKFSRYLQWSRSVIFIVGN